MDELMRQLLQKQSELDELIQYAEKYLETAQQGKLRITRNHNTEQYYVKSDSVNTYGTYVSKKDNELIHGIAQKDYITNLLRYAKSEEKRVQQLIKRYEPEGIEHIYDKLSMKRKKVVQPYILPDDQFVSRWMSETYERKPIEIAEENRIITEKGEIVRSKSEKILADKLSRMDIPYHYEKPIYLNGYGTIHPDFTTLNRRIRKVFYWEHLGLMDQSSYSEKAILKIEMMQRNGIFVGDKLIITYETSNHPLNIKSVESLIEKYLL